MINSARPGTHTPCSLAMLRRMGPRLRGDDAEFVALQLSNSPPSLKLRRAKPRVIARALCRGPGQARLSFPLQNRGRRRANRRCHSLCARTIAGAWRLSARHRGFLSPWCRSFRAGQEGGPSLGLPLSGELPPAFVPAASSPRGAAGLGAGGRVARASRVRACETCARAPHPAPSSRRLATTPSKTSRTIGLYSFWGERQARFAGRRLYSTLNATSSANQVRKCARAGPCASPA